MTTKEYLELYRKQDQTEEDLLKIKEFNRSLCEKYPFLIPWNRWTGTLITDKEKCFYGGEDRKIEDNPEYDYEYTEMDSLPEGWRLAFGDQMLEEIREELVKYDFLESYRVSQIKEKWGFLHWYDDGIPVGKLSEDYEVYERPYCSKEVPEDWNNSKFLYKLVETLNHKPVFGQDITKEESEANYKWNEEHAIEVYHKHRILERCKLREIIHKYEDISENVCIRCGKPAKYVTKGWITYICEDCAEKELAREKESKYYKIDENVTIDEFFSKIEDNKN